MLNISPISYCTRSHKSLCIRLQPCNSLDSISNLGLAIARLGCYLTRSLARNRGPSVVVIATLGDCIKCVLEPLWRRFILSASTTKPFWCPCVFYEAEASLLNCCLVCLPKPLRDILFIPIMIICCSQMAE